MKNIIKGISLACLHDQHFKKKITQRMYPLLNDPLIFILVCLYILLCLYWIWCCETPKN